MLKKCLSVTYDKYLYSRFVSVYTEPSLAHPDGPMPGFVYLSVPKGMQMVFQRDIPLKTLAT